jgi:hypothetical protein
VEVGLLGKDLLVEPVPMEALAITVLAAVVVQVQLERAAPGTSVALVALVLNGLQAPEFITLAVAAAVLTITQRLEMAVLVVVVLAVRLQMRRAVRALQIPAAAAAAAGTILLVRRVALAGPASSSSVIPARKFTPSER